jgi:cell division protein FtsW
MSGAAGSLRLPFTRRRRKAKAKRAKARAQKPIEYSLLLTATMCLVALGVVMVFSASSSASLLETGDGAYYLKRTLMFGAFGLLAMHVLARYGLSAIRRLTPLVLLGSIVLLVAVMVPGIGSSVNGAQSWIVMGSIQVQPSEIAKVALLLYGASILAERPQMTRDLRGMAPYLLVAGAVLFLVLLEPDLGTAMVTAFAISALLIAAGAKLRHLGIIAGALLFVGFVGVLMEPYRMERVTTFLNPSSDPSGAGFQTMQATIALGSGGFFGVGIGESVPKAF